MISTSRKRLPCLALFLTLSCGQPGPIDPVQPQDEASLGPLLKVTVDEYLTRVEAQPASAATHGRLGLLYEANHLTSEAARSYANALALDPDDPTWNFRLAIAKITMGDFEEGSARLLTALDEMPRSAAAHHRAGYLYMDQGEMERALTSFRSAVALAPDGAAPLAEASLGEALVAVDRPAEAIEPLENALKAAPNLKPALYAYGLALRALGRIDQAEIALEAGLGAERIMIPHASGVGLQELGMGYGQRNTYATSLSGKGETARAIRVLEHLLEYYPDDEVVVNNLAGVYMQLEDWDQAKLLLADLTASGTDRFGAWLNLAITQKSLGNIAEARKAIDHAVVLLPGQARGQIERAEICMIQRDAAGALESATRVCELEPENPRAFLLAAEANTRLGLDEAACAAFEQVNRLNASFLPSRVSAAALYLSAGRLADAERLILEAEEIDPSEARVIQIRSRLQQVKRGVR
jgi:tetratricopeptide (TPR) repeat protein